MVKSVLVTGATGLIGGALTDRLLASGIRVVGLDVLPNKKTPVEGFSWIQGDMGTIDLEAALNGTHIDAVVHCAAHPGGLSLAEPVEDVRVNAFGNMRLFEWAARHSVQTVFLSSSVIYGNQEFSKPIDEQVALAPGTIYGACKVASEGFIKILSEKFKNPWTILRLFSTFGAGHTPNPYQGIVNVLLSQMLKGDRVVVKGSLERVRDLIHAEDAALAISQCLGFEPCYGKTLNVCSGTPVKISDILDALKVAMRRPNIEVVVEAGTVGDPFYNVGDCGALKKLTGFTTQLSLLQGIEKTVQPHLRK